MQKFVHEYRHFLTYRATCEFCSSRTAADYKSFAAKTRNRNQLDCNPT
jgi:hypothetical protein